MKKTIKSLETSGKVRELGSRHYLASFVPTQPLTHIVEMRLNGEPVKGACYLRVSERKLFALRLFSHVP
ncbi:MAG: hypothetical protein GY820_13190 [Gammaproteobacteria bacterium]|nr:hypothetical protein [Gammaproteobacteria bacterium]